MAANNVTVHYADTEGRVHGHLRIVVPPAGVPGIDAAPIITLDDEEFRVESMTIEHLIPNDAKGLPALGHIVVRDHPPARPGSTATGYCTPTIIVDGQEVGCRSLTIVYPTPTEKGQSMGVTDPRPAIRCDNMDTRTDEQRRRDGRNMLLGIAAVVIVSLGLPIMLWVLK